MFRILKIGIVLFLLVCGACQNPKVPATKITASASIDSIQLNYEKSKDKSNTIPERTNFIHKAYHIAKTSANDSLILKTLDFKTQLHNALKETDSAIYYSKQMLLESQRIKDFAAEGKANFKIGLYFDKSQKKDSAYYYYNAATKVYAAMPDSVEVAKVLVNMAIILSDISDYNESDQTAIKALTYLENSDEIITKGNLYNCLAISAKRQEDYQEALYWYGLAIKTTESKKNSLIYQNNMANVYARQGKYDEAIATYNILLQDSLITEDPHAKIRTYDNLNYTKWLQTGDKNLEEAFLEALQQRTEKNNLPGQISSNFHLSKFYESQNISKSRQHALAMHGISEKINNMDDRLESLTILMNLYKNDLEQFQKYSGKYIHLKDSISVAKRTVKNQFAKIRYDSERNRLENAELKTETIQQQLDLEKSNRLKSTYLSMGLLFLLSAVFIVVQIQSRHKKEKLQQVYLTETRISKKVHDEVANDVYHVMTKLQNNSNKEEVLDDLEGIYTKTRDISKENSPVDFSENFEVVLQDLLWSYKDKNVNIITQNLSKINWNTISNIKKMAIYRVLQEIMTNMKKHSKATLVIISFSKPNKNLHIAYKDDGIGCTLKKNTGLQNAENRIHTLNGNIIFESEIQHGFQVKITI